MKPNKKDSSYARHTILKWASFIGLSFAIFVQTCFADAKVVLYCGKIKYGCEDVDTNTLQIEIESKNLVKVIRQYHGSDLPITSAFIGKFTGTNIITAEFNKALTEKNARQSQSELPSGSIRVELKCVDASKFVNCEVSGEPLSGSMKTLGAYPGWNMDKFYGSRPEKLKCNLKAFTTTEAVCADDETE